MKNLNQFGFGHLGTIMVFIVICGAIGYTGVQVAQKDKPSSESASSATESSGSTVSKEVRWSGTADGGWTPSATPPACPKPFELKSPTPQLSKATAVLMPGQTRGNNYKPHGGLRFDKQTNNEIKVVSPIDGYLYRGARYLEQGEVQYMFDIINPCGFMVRFDHLKELSPAFQRYADNLPAAKADDSRTANIQSSPKIEAGDAIAAQVGFANKLNVGFDFGVYDLRQPNKASQNTEFQAIHQNDKELSWYGVCWLDMFSTSNSKFVNSLPGGDQIAGKQSDYCK